MLRKHAIVILLLNSVILVATHVFLFCDNIFIHWSALKVTSTLDISSCVKLLMCKKIKGIPAKFFPFKLWKLSLPRTDFLNECQNINSLQINVSHPQYYHARVLIEDQVVVKYDGVRAVLIKPCKRWYKVWPHAKPCKMFWFLDHM